ncbi:MAG: TIGR00730 family Rossman fold protein [Saprospiraceae bacterium]|nr:TIGR00730 family Rossman fold protein [Saprospiraceae bacterium]MCF8250631.1 TIGR00730 family Rossman fold protein [Saprospiraceae bacterium]MCF8282406.1 TIGR00730 family Rossman fold protein [Bacteroidales bacterium]MCF8312262.1 TIGR00730 family Rossman fold protein [Saprospiraceae bacterium]MCF8442819.1 TIGR00730 family Rossman fold protein [Saprospiraceae bacterium]
MKSISVFCGANKGFDPAYATAAVEIGQTFAKQKIQIVYGAGNVGLMGILADAALAAGGEVLGVIPDFLQKKEVCHKGLTELILTKTMHERKQIMAERSDGFLILPGGFGTLDEFFEILTWRQLRLHEKPIGVLDVGGYYQHLLAHVRQMFEKGFLREANLHLFVVAENLPELLEKMAQPVNISEEKWL